MANIEQIRHYEKQLRAAKTLIDNLVQDAAVWRQIPSYIRFGRLEYFSLLPSFLSSLRFGFQQGYLTHRQIREYRNLERLAKDAMGTIKALKQLDEEMLKRERRDTE